MSSSHRASTHLSLLVETADHVNISGNGMTGSVPRACDTAKDGACSRHPYRDLSGDYVVEDRRPDGRVLLRPDLSVKAMLSRHGERKLTTEEFEQHFGQLPTDGEG